MTMSLPRISTMLATLLVFFCPRRAATTDPDPRGAGQGEVGRRAEQLSAPRRPHSQSRRLQGTPSRRRMSDRRGRGSSRATGQDRPSQLSDQKLKQFRMRRTSFRVRSAACWRSARTIPTSSPTRISSRCSRSSKAPRTASPWRGATTSKRCGLTTPSSRPSPASCGPPRSSARTSRWRSSPPTRTPRSRRK